MHLSQLVKVDLTSLTVFIAFVTWEGVGTPAGSFVDAAIPLMMFVTPEGMYVAAAEGMSVATLVGTCTFVGTAVGTAVGIAVCGTLGTAVACRITRRNITATCVSMAQKEGGTKEETQRSPAWGGCHQV